MKPTHEIRNRKLKELMDGISKKDTEKVDLINIAELRDIYSKASKINKELIYNYDYAYYDLIEDSIVPNEKLNEKYGNSRKGYELFGKDNNEYGVGYSGQVSLRELYLRGTNEVVGYITETKKPSRPFIQEAESLYEEAFNKLVELLDVKDEENLNYYINDNNSFDFLSKDRANEFTSKIYFLIETLEQYNNDEEFRKFFDKIIK